MKTLSLKQLSRVAHSSVSYRHHIAHYIAGARLSSNCKFVPFDHLPPVPPPLPLISFSSSFLKI